MINILFVDDDPSMLSSLKRGLRRRRDEWDMTFLDQPQDAMEHLGAKHFELVVSDIRMPGKSGIDLLTEIKHAHPRTGVILMTGMPCLDAAIEAMKLGAADYLQKPVDLDKLQTAIEKVIKENFVAGQAQGLLVPKRQTIGDYDVVKKLSEGSMGLVFLVEKPTEPDTIYALKVIKTNLLRKSNSDEILERFRREFDAASKITHSNVVRLFEFGVEGKEKVPFIVMEYFPGTPLDTLIDRKLLGFSEKLDIMIQISAALSAVHEVITCHRDIKPGNILVNDEGVAKLIDFGIVKISTSQLTQTDCVLGSPAYLAPEMILPGKDVDSRADLFALGSVAYELFTNERPFFANNLAALAWRITNNTPESPRKYCSDMPRKLEAIIMKLLNKDPKLRFETAQQVIEQLTMLKREI